jgi:hypothetical protein
MIASELQSIEPWGRSNPTAHVALDEHYDISTKEGSLLDTVFWLCIRARL